jgi:hypothetical protein
MDRQHVLSLVLCVLVQQCCRASQADERSPALHVSLAVSHRELQTGDGLPVKLLITNRSISTVQVSGVLVEPHYLCSIHVRNADKSWSPVWYSVDPRKLHEPGVIRISAGETWAEYGMIPISTKRGRVFRAAGSYEVRAALSCPLGEYTTESVKLIVRKAHPDEFALIEKLDPSLSTLFNATAVPNRQRCDEIIDLSSRVKSGSNRLTLRLFHDVIMYRETGAVEGNAMTHYEVFKKMASGIDEVRRDQLAILLASEARRLNKWKDVADLAGELKENSAPRQVLQVELDRVIRTGGFKRP